MKTFWTFSLLSSLSLLSIGCAGNQLARSSEPAAARRGYLAASGSSVKAIVAGPIAIHVYAEVAGGRVFVTERKSGANIDGDCETAATREGSGPALPADRVQLIVVGAGEIACLATSGRRGYEMLWHARNDGDAPLVLAQGR